MSRVRLVHWKESEAQPRIAALIKAGFEVDFDARMSTDQLRSLRESPPDAIVIDLSRMPSQGRVVGSFFRGSKKTRHIPLVFVDGPPEKVEDVRTLMPDAIYSTWPKAAAAIRKAIANPPADPITPPQMMRDRGRTSAKKIGIQENSTVLVVDPPRDYMRILSPLPDGVEFLEEPGDWSAPITLWFLQSIDALMEGLDGMRRSAGRSKLWVLWQKKKSGDRAELTQLVIREALLDAGLVDHKICSVDPVWSGMAVARRKVKN